MLHQYHTMVVDHQKEEEYKKLENDKNIKNNQYSEILKKIKIKAKC